MRTLALAVVALLASTSAAFARPASVSVTLGPVLATKGEAKYGADEVSRLAQQLQMQVTRRLADSTAFDGARLELVLEDVQPNRPTLQQQKDMPGLSLRSISLGGIRISGRAIAPDGHVTPLAYSWYETDLRNVRGYGVWTDADNGIDTFASQLSRGRAVASR